MSDTTSRQEELLGHRYVLDGLIGCGGMAEVYRAHDRVLGRAVAVKLLRSRAANAAERARFADEARTLARLNHPGLVTVLDAATTGDRPYLVMELVRGASLADHCHRGLAPARVAAIGAQLADALGYVHRAGVVHRDLKPGNVLLAAGDRALLTDFGIARLVSGPVRHTSTGVRIGTAAYMAPEQVAGREITPAVDVYALGLVLLEALTGVPAYRGLPVEAALARLTTPPDIPDTVPAAWHGPLRTMTALRPQARPPAAAVAATLRGLAAGVDPGAATAALPTAAVAHATAGRGDTGTHRRGAGTRSLGHHVPGQHPLGPLRRRWSGRAAARWRWLTGATVAAALVALLTASITQGDADSAGDSGSGAPDTTTDAVIDDAGDGAGAGAAPAEPPPRAQAAATASRDGRTGDARAPAAAAQPADGAVAEEDSGGQVVAQPVERSGAGDGADGDRQAPASTRAAQPAGATPDEAEGKASSRAGTNAGGNGAGHANGKGKGGG